MLEELSIDQLESLRATVNSSIKTGILNKKGRGKIFRPWHLRTIELNPSLCKLLYYNGKKLKGEINLRGCTVRLLSPTEADGRDHAFIVTLLLPEKGKSNQLVLAAGSNNEAIEWVERIQMVIDRNSGSTNEVDKYVYESFDTIATKQPSQQILDANYYKNLRAKNQEEKIKKSMSSNNISIGVTTAVVES
mmetsp:Transcript_21039/g.19170  ORF Transcript_21039/g.19170 Transcript_21039/m.19170 type:complete len:191 (+) Transcript_21039:3-575(+)